VEFGGDEMKILSNKAKVSVIIDVKGMFPGNSLDMMRAYTNRYMEADLVKGKGGYDYGKLRIDLSGPVDIVRGLLQALSEELPRPDESMVNTYRECYSDGSIYRVTGWRYDDYNDLIYEILWITEGEEFELSDVGADHMDAKYILDDGEVTDPAVITKLKLIEMK
jgi:hypothetical protein